MREVLPWWTSTAMKAAHKLGVQQQTARIDGLDREGNARQSTSGPPPWANIIKTRKW